MIDRKEINMIKNIKEHPIGILNKQTIVTYKEPAVVVGNYDHAVVGLELLRQNASGFPVDTRLPYDVPTVALALRYGLKQIVADMLEANGAKYVATSSNFARNGIQLSFSPTLK